MKKVLFLFLLSGFPLLAMNENPFDSTNFELIEGLFWQNMPKEEIDLQSEQFKLSKKLLERKNTDNMRVTDYLKISEFSDGQCISYSVSDVHIRSVYLHKLWECYNGQEKRETFATSTYSHLDERGDRKYNLTRFQQEQLKQNILKELKYYESKIPLYAIISKCTELGAKCPNEMEAIVEGCEFSNGVEFEANDKTFYSLHDEMYVSADPEGVYFSIRTGWDVSKGPKKSTMEILDALGTLEYCKQEEYEFNIYWPNQHKYKKVNVGCYSIPIMLEKEEIKRVRENMPPFFAERIESFNDIFRQICPKDIDNSEIAQYCESVKEFKINLSHWGKD